MAVSETGALTLGRAVPSLVRWGVSADADLVYRCLASFGPRGAGEVAADLGLAPRRVRVALEELVEAGLVRGEPDAHGVEAGRWNAVAPAAAVQALRRRALHRIPTGGPDRRERGPVPTRLLPDLRATRERIAGLVAVERVEHLAMNPEQAFTTDTLAIGSAIDADLLGRRVRVRSLGLPPADGDRSSAYTAEFARLGGEYRLADRVPHKMMIFDRRVALVAVDPLDLERGSWEFTDPGAVESLVTLFARQWSGATDPRRNGVPTVVLTQREKAVVALLADGHTDATAAKHLGMSTRTLTYTLRGLMDRFGVENRFQLGLALGAMRAAAPPGPAGDELAEGSGQ
ncbi:helix-turn-helix transcriptional regulator [Phytohabitans sp. ZYX-F-186]|uniref:Helix-turn-helix transcriptional regulator n=1 Tax=Phytohabitans maris TaxID=3071409 RepID=A0ABU0ZMT3_9ACTN|nr:helix-turn-helix transcriptional regulator [Phytohabitans sp. ZYX-F-186]MDQ7908344.1 helix-turn-helix transcriptional regulator [Phytohabitans sp. ZYX-F-186]